jgi:hypothetical protein
MIDLVGMLENSELSGYSMAVKIATRPMPR